MMACLTCKFYEPKYAEYLDAQCRLNPPTVIDEGLYYWPEVEAVDWCGQWESKDGTTQSKRGLE